MSDNKPHWVDYANLAANVAQNIRLSQLHSTLSALASLQAERAQQEQNQQQAMERENRLREFIWRLEIAFDTYLRNPGATPSGRFAVAKQMIAGLAHLPGHSSVLLLPGMGRERQTSNLRLLHSCRQLLFLLLHRSRRRLHAWLVTDAVRRTLHVHIGGLVVDCGPHSEHRVGHGLGRTRHPPRV